MVLRRRRRLALSGPVVGGMLLATQPLGAQQIDRTASALAVTDDIPAPVGIKIGRVVVLPSGEARIEYDSNIYAEPDNPVDDAIVVFTPRVEARLDAGPAQLSVLAEARLRRFLDHSSENSDAGLLQAQGSYAVSATDALSARLAARRVVEDRGDPEARDTRSTGPRKLDVFDTEGSWKHDTRTFQFELAGNATRIDYKAPVDSDRDLSLYGARGSLTYDFGGAWRPLLSGFVTRRDYRLAQDFTGVNRDAVTYGARAGIQIVETGFLRGQVSVGAFRFNPEDATLRGRTGVSAEATVTYLPWRRVAFTLDGFRGDVATVRSGAQSRTDTTFRLGTQVEARRNLRFQASVFSRRSNFIGSGVSERTLGVSGEAEYRLNRFFSIAAVANHSDRNSDDPSQPFERTRAAIELRTQF